MTSFCLFDITTKALYFAAWSIRCKNHVLDEDCVQWSNSSCWASYEPIQKKIFLFNIQHLYNIDLKWTFPFRVVKEKSAFYLYWLSSSERNSKEWCVLNWNCSQGHLGNIDHRKTSTVCSVVQWLTLQQLVSQFRKNISLQHTTSLHVIHMDMVSTGSRSLSLNFLVLAFDRQNLNSPLNSFCPPDRVVTS